jgi:hypothetical protein
MHGLKKRNIALMFQYKNNPMKKFKQSGKNLAIKVSYLK